jgi:hypothetical protein
MNLIYKMTEGENIIPLHQRWLELRKKLRVQFGRAPDMNAILMLIGINELGRVQPKFEKEEKEDLMHIATCRLLSRSGYYKKTGVDAEGWPHWELVKPMPAMDLKQQEDFLKEHVLQYFKEMEN